MTFIISELAFEASGSQYSALLLQVILEYKQWYFSKLITLFHSVKFSSVVQLCLTPCDPMDCSMPGFPVHQQLPKFAQTHVHWIDDAMQLISSSVISFSSCPQSSPASGFFPMSSLFSTGDQSIGASTSVLSMNIQGWFSLGLIYLISLLSRGL